MPPRVRLNDSLVSSISSLRITPPSSQPIRRCLFENRPSSQSYNHAHARFIHSTSCLSVRQKKEIHNSPWVVEKREAKKAKNLKRQTELQQVRESAKLDPVLGQPTPWTKSLHMVHPTLATVDAIMGRPDKNTSKSSEKEKETIHKVAESEDIGPLNYNLSKKALSFALEQSDTLTRPYGGPVDGHVDRRFQEKVTEFEVESDRAVAAMHRILSLGNGSAKDRAFANKQRCIAEFGRHYTDKNLPLPQKMNPDGSVSIKTGEPRAGPDTGSSEVQIAILTSKINYLSKHLETATKDKANKRNLRLLVHRRQKLLKYLKKKERGGPRYQNIMASIGLDDAAVTEEIFM